MRRKLEMGERSRLFSRANPSPEASYTPLLARLEDRLSRAAALEVQQRVGRSTGAAARARRQELRRTIQFQLLRHLVRTGEAAAREHPELLGKFRLRSDGATHRAFLSSCKAMHAEGLAHKDLLVSYGLSETLLDDLGRNITEFEAASAEAIAARRAHVGARAELAESALEVMQLVERLNGLHRYRFGQDPERLAAWENARSLNGKSRTRAPIPPANGGVTPPSGGAAPTP